MLFDDSASGWLSSELVINGDSSNVQSELAVIGDSFTTSSELAAGDSSSPSRGSGIETHC